MMKKIFKVLTFTLVIAAVFMGGVFLTACNNQNSEYAGSYIVSSYVDSEINVTREQYQANPSNYDEWDISGWFEMTIELNKDGKFEQHQESSSYIQKGKWSVVGEKINLTVDNELYFEFTVVNDSTLTYMPYSSTTLTLSKINF